METKKTETEFIRKITDMVKEETGKRTVEKSGLLLVAYDTDKDGIKQHAYVGFGTPANFAECLYSSMMRDPMLANVIMAASNAVAQNRMMEAQMKMAASETETKKKKSKKLS